ncbi:hypothetical protein V8C86DRAFT_1723068 [Haematococcus lacustris]
MPAAPDAADTPQTSVEGIPAAEEVALISDESSPGAPAAQAAAGGATVATRRNGRSRQHGAHPGGRVISPVERLRNAGTGRKTTGNNIRAQPPQPIRKEEFEEGEEKEEEQEQQPGAAEADKTAGPGQQRPRWQQPTAVKACGKAVKKVGKKAGGGAGREAGATLAASEASGASDTSELSSFERQRVALIARNNAMLAALALPQLAVAVNGLVSPAAASGVKGLRKRCGGTRDKMQGILCRGGHGAQLSAVSVTVTIAASYAVDAWCDSQVTCGCEPDGERQRRRYD